MTLKMIVHKDETGGFWAEDPSLQGCLSQADSIEDLKDNMREAIEGWLKVKEDKQQKNKIKPESKK